MQILVATGYPDSEGEVINLQGMQIDNPIKVIADFDFHHVLGLAQVWVKGEFYLMADIQLKPGIQLIADTYPSIGFQALKRNGNCVEESKLIYIGICKGKNMDERVKSVGEQQPNHPSIKFYSKPAI